MKTTIKMASPIRSIVGPKSAPSSRATLKDILLRGLERELRTGNENPETSGPLPPLLRPARSLLQGLPGSRLPGRSPKPGDRDITELISDDREGR